MVFMTNNEADQLADSDLIGLLVLRIVQALVDDSSSVNIACKEQNGATCFRLKLGVSDIGKVIGKQGRTASAIRTVLATVSKKTGRQYTLDIDVPE